MSSSPPQHPHTLISKAIDTSGQRRKLKTTEDWNLQKCCLERLILHKVHQSVQCSLNINPYYLIFKKRILSWYFQQKRCLGGLHGQKRFTVSATWDWELRFRQLIKTENLDKNKILLPKQLICISAKLVTFLKKKVLAIWHRASRVSVSSLKH